MIISKSTKLLLFLSGLFISCIVVAEIIGGKIFSLEDTLGFEKFSFEFFGEKNLSLNLSVGVLPWPFVFIITDIINDYFGMRTVRFISFISVFFIFIMFLFLFVSIHTSSETTWWLGSKVQMGVPNMQKAFVAIFGQGMNIIFASIVAFILGQLIDSFVFREIKKRTGDKWKGLRATASTLVSQFIDSVVVTIVAFYFLSTMSLGMALALAFTAYIYKFIVAIFCTPILYFVHFCIESYLGKELAIEMRTNR